ncbi:sulfatase-like hydrolase/transferase [Synechococcus sp. CS-1330]|nr:sulfatase-like hydrolase/transferase [Synechococcus sp. CS-1330]
MARKRKSGANKGLTKERDGSNKLPNIVILLTDQERSTDLWMPQEFVQNKDILPTQNYLKDNGLSFTNAFTNTNMCSSARATFFTGKFPAQHGVANLLADTNNPVINDQTQLNPDLPNLATLLQEAGYAADNIFYKGKWHISKSLTRTFGTADPSDDVEVYTDMSQYGFNQWEGPDAGGTASHPLGGPKTTGTLDPRVENPANYPDGYDAGYTQQAVDLINSRSNSDEPFVLVLSLVNPHDLLTYPVPVFDSDNGDVNIDTQNILFKRLFGYDFKDLIGPSGKVPGMSENLLPNNKDGTIPADYTEKPHLQYENLQGIDNFFPKPKTELERLSYINFYLNLIARADQEQYRVIEALRENSLIEDTLIVKTSDHGEMGLAHGGTRQKANVAYQEAVQVPLLWSLPGHIKPGKSSAVVSHVDFLPTLGGLLGVSKEKTKSMQLSGVDYSAVVEGKQDKAQKYTLFTFDDVYTAGDPSDVFPTTSMDPAETWNYQGKKQNPAYGIFDNPNRIYMIQNEDFKLVRYYSVKDPGNQKLWQEEFYDRRPNGGDYYQPTEKEQSKVYRATDPITGEEVLINAGFLSQGELVPGLSDLRVAKGYNSSFAPAPLELKNLSPWAEEIRKLQGKQTIATSKQKKAYERMRRQLDNAVANRLNPIAPMPAVAPEIVNDNEGNPIFNLTPSRLGGGLTQDLEIAFTSRSSQTYAVQYLDTYISSSGETNTWVTAASGIKGTNGPIYQYIKGIPNNITAEEVRVQWIGSSLTDYPSNALGGYMPFRADTIGTGLSQSDPSMAATAFSNFL